MTADHFIYMIYVTLSAVSIMVYMGAHFFCNGEVQECKTVKC